MFINNFDPVAFEIFSFEIRWYSLAYIFGILIGIAIQVYLGVTESAKKTAVKKNFKAVVEWIKADAALCKMNGSTSKVFRQTNSNGGGQQKDCGNVTDYNKTPFHENVLQTHIGYIGVAGKNPYGSVGSDRTCDLAKSWADMTSITKGTIKYPNMKQKN